MFHTRFKSVMGPIGIDLGASGIKMLQLKLRGATPCVHAAAVIDLHHDEQPSDDVLASQIRQRLQENRFSGRQCIVSLPRTETHMQSVRMPQVSDNELHQTAYWEAAERFQLDRESLEVDFIRMGEIASGAESRDEVFIIAIERETLQRRLELLVASGLQPLAVDHPVASFIRLHSIHCRRESDRSHVRAFLEIGSSGATFVVTRGDQIALCKPIDVGGRLFDESVADHLGIERSVAHELRLRRLGEQPSNTSTGDHFVADASFDRAKYEAVRTLMNLLCKEIGLCMRYYGVTFRGQPPQQIILSGGDGMEPHLNELIGKACNVPVSTDDSASSVQELLGAIRSIAGSSTRPVQCWSVAAGLSLRGLPLKVDIAKRRSWFARKEAA